MTLEEGPLTDERMTDNIQRVRRYYDRTESRLGYTYLMGGSKHYGWYEPGQGRWQFKAAMARMEDELEARLALPADSYLLDAGCGTGAVARALASRHGHRVLGLDVLEWNIKEARDKSAIEGLADRTEFRLGDYHRLDIASSVFNGAYTMETLVHSGDPDAMLRELFRVLQPGGRVALFEYSHKGQDELQPAAWEALRRVCASAEMPAWLHFEDGVLDSKLATAGFRDIYTEDVTPRMLPMLEAFDTLGRFPYWVGRRVGKVEKTVNAMSAVEMNRHRSAWRYNITTATKPA